MGCHAEEVVGDLSLWTPLPTKHPGWGIHFDCFVREKIF